MKILSNLFRWLFLAKEIISQEGVLHFQRWRVIATPWFNLYVHHILQSDQDRHFHDHPWNFRSLILRGSYRERVSYPPYFFSIHSYRYQAGEIAYHERRDAHHITLLTPSVWSLVLTTGRKRDWGYQTKNGWVDHQTYRKLKNEGKLPL